MDIIGITLSLLSLSAVSIAILSDKRIRGHPNNIIAYICICDAYTYCQYLTRYIICGYNLTKPLERLFSWTFMEPYYYISIEWLGIEYYDKNGNEITWASLEAYQEKNGFWYGSMATRLQSWYLLSITISYMSLFFSLSTVMDLYLVLKNPFSSSEKRIKKFIIASVLSAVTFASVGLVLTNRQN